MTPGLLLWLIGVFGWAAIGWVWAKAIRRTE